MESEELVRLMKQIDEKGLAWEKVEEKIKVPRKVLDLYTRSGPVPVTIIKSLKKVLEEAA